MKKKILSIILAVSVLASVFSGMSAGTVLAADETYDAAPDKVIMDFEQYKNSKDLCTLNYDTRNPWQMDSTLKNTLETDYAISGSKSLRIAWDVLGPDDWKADRYYMFGGYLENQAMYMDVVSIADWDAYFSVYSEADGIVYTYNKKITGSKNVQHILLPFNEFKNNGNTMTKAQWDNLRGGTAIFKIDINKCLEGLEDNGFILIDNMTLVSAEGPDTEPEYNYTVYPEHQKPNPGELDTETGYREVIKYTPPVKSAVIDSAEEFTGDGLYVKTNAASDCNINIKITDGKLNLYYTAPVSEKDVNSRLNFDYTEFTNAYGTYHELDKSKTKINISFDGDAEILSAGIYDYSLMTVAEGGETKPDTGKHYGEDFETMTDEEAADYFKGSKDGTVRTNSAITDNGQNGSKGLSLTMDIPYAWAWLNYYTDTLDIPYNAYAVRIWYTLDQDTNMRLQLKDQTWGAWTDIAFEGSKESKGLVKAGTYCRTVYFRDTEFNPNNQYALGIEAGATRDGNQPSILTIDNLEFICTEGFDDFEFMSDAQANEYLRGSKDDSVTTSARVTSDGENGSKGMSLTMNIPYRWAWLNYSSEAYDIPKGSVGVRIWYTLNQDTDMRLQLRDYTEGAWTDIAFEGTKESKGRAKAGTYSKTVYFKNTEYNPAHQYSLGLEASATEDGRQESVLTIDNIVFLKGDATELNAEIESRMSVMSAGSKNYTDASWRFFVSKFIDARSLDVLFAGQSQIDSALEGLRNAYNALSRLGDFDKNRILNSNDLIMMRKILLGQKDTDIAGDMNKDGDVDILDMVMLKKAAAE